MAKRRARQLTPFKQVEKYVNEQVIPRFRIPHFSVHCGSDPCSEDAYAEITIPGGHHHGSLALSRNFFTLPRRFQRETLAHEVAHCVVRGMADVNRSLLDAADGLVLPVNFRPMLEMALGAIVAAHAQQEEFAVETFAQALQELLPLPKFEVGRDFQHLLVEDVSHLQAPGTQVTGGAKSRGVRPHAHRSGRASCGRRLRQASPRKRP